MTDALPKLSNGRLPMRKHGQYLEGVSEWKRHKLIVAMVVGIEAEIDDKIVGVIPPNTPLTLDKACRAIDLFMKSGRRLWLNPVFQGDYKAAIATELACHEPKNMAAMAKIRDNPLSRDRDKIAAVECLRGPKPIAGVQINNYQQNNAPAQPAGYVVNLSGEPVPNSEPKIIEEGTMPASRRSGGR